METTTALSDRKPAVLVVDEDGSIDRKVEGLLGTVFPQGHRLTRAEGLREAMKLLSAGGFDVLFLHLPATSREETMRSVRSEAPHIPLIVLTSGDDFGVHHLAGRTTVAAYLQKHELTARMILEGLGTALAAVSAQPDPELRGQNDMTAQLRNMVVHAPYPAVLLSLSGIIEYINPAAERMTEFTRNEVVGKFAFDFLRPERASEVRDAIQVLRTTPGTVRLLRLQTIRKEGGVRDVEATGTNVADHGVVRSIVVYFRDITEDLLREKKIAESERAFRSMMESMDDIVYTLDRDLRCTAVYGTWVDRAGLSAERMIGKTAVESLGEEIGAVHLRAGRAALLGQPVTFEWDQMQTSVRRTVQTTLSPLKDKDGRVTGLVALGRDITKMRRALDDVRELSVAVSQSPACVVITDIEGSIQYVNPRFLDLTGYSLEEVLGANPKILQSGQTPRPTYDRLWSALVAGRTWRGELCNRKKNGTLYWESAVIAPLKNEKGVVTGYVAIKQDVTEERKTREELNRSHETFLKTFNASSQAIVVARLSDGVVLEVNDGFVRMLGYAKQEILQQATPSLNIWVDPRERKVLVGRLRREETITDAVASLRRKDGVVIEAVGSGSIIKVEGVPSVVFHFDDLTERRRRLREMAASRELFRKVFDANPAASIILGPDQRIIDVNERWTRETGYARREVIGQTMREIQLAADPVNGDRLWSLIQRRLPVRDLPFAERRKDGTLAEVLVTANWVEVDGQECVMCVSVDLTEQRRIQDALRQSEKNYRMLFANNPHPMWAFDRTTLEFLAVNAATVETYGYTREEFLGMRVTDIRPAEEVPRLLERVATLADSVEYAGRWRHRTKEGRIMEVEVTSHTMPFDGRDAVVVLAQDVTKRLAAETQLRASEERYRRLFDETVNGIFVTGMDGTIEACNPAFAQMFGFASVDEALRSNTNLLYRSTQDRQAYVDRLIGEGKVENYEQEMRRIDGAPVFTVINAFPRTNAEGTVIGFHGYVVDDTRRRVLERQLFQAQKMEGLGTLAGGIAHDFNNILGIIMAHQSLLQMLEGQPDRQRNSLEAIGKASERGAGLVRQLLTFARIKEPTLGPLDAREVLNELHKLLAETFPKVITVAFENEPDLPAILADATQLHQVVLNLCVNARDAMMPSGGALRVTARHVADTVEISVSDTGEGMDEALRLRIFDPFFTTKPKGKGTGLGLSTVYGIVAAHQGRIDVTSAPGAGSTFRVSLPIAEASAQVRPQIEGPTGLLRGTETVFIVEDESSLRIVLKDVFERQGYRVLTASDGEEALETFVRESGRIDIIVSDYGLPKISGAEVARRLHELSPNLRIIITSGYIDPVDRENMLAAGVDAIILKPFAPLNILRQARKLLDGRSPASAPAAVLAGE